MSVELTEKEIKVKEEEIDDIQKECFSLDDLQNLLIQAIKFEMKDVSPILILLEKIYLDDQYSNISMVSLFLLQYFSDKYLKNFNSPYYQDIIKGILSYHRARICNDFLIFEKNTNDFYERETQNQFNLND